MKLAGRVAAVALAAATVFTAVWMGLSRLGNDVPASVSVAGEVVFTGGEENYEYVNPTGATAWAESENGGMEALRWRIMPAGGGGILYEGEGDTAGGVLAEMLARGEWGEYDIAFYMRDAEGHGGWLTRRFALREGPGA
jgi:hypothetical protein